MAKGRKASTEDDPMVDFEEVEIPEGASLDDVIGIVNKRAKRTVLKRASEAASPFLLRRPFRIASMDCACGGGMASGGVTQIAAPTGIGKNALANQAISSIQHLYGDDAKVAWVWLELPYDKEHARINGVIVPSSDTDIELENLERVKRGLPRLNADEVTRRRIECGEFIIADEGSTEERLQACLDLIADNECQLIVLDSIASVVSHYRVETDMNEEPRQAATAWLLTEFQRMLWHHFANPAYGSMNMTTLLIINQVRANRNKRSAFDRDWVSQGAYAIRHGKLLDITMSPGKRIPEKSTKPRKGKWVRWEVTKGKAGCHEGGKGEIAYYFRHGFDVFADVVATADSYGVLPKNGQKRDLVKLDGTVLEEKLPWGKGGGDLVKEVYTNPDLFEAMYYASLEAAEVSCLHRL